MRLVRDSDLRKVIISPDGIVLNRQLADQLSLSVGDQVSIEALEGKRTSFTVPLTDKVDEVLGAGAYMELDTLHRFMNENSVVTHAAIRSPKNLQETLAVIATRPNVLVSLSKEKWISMFREKIMGIINVSAAILTLFGVIISIGVVYNSARVAFQERTWELASLRILGFTRSEVANILFTELAISLLLSIPIGLYLAKSGISFLLSSRSNESFSIPPVIHTDTLALAVVIVIGTALLSSWIIKMRIDKINLVSALKARD